MPEESTRKRFSFVYRGSPVAEGAGLQVRVAGRMDVESLTLDGCALALSETDGYGAWQDDCSTFIVVVLLRLEARQYKIEVPLTATFAVPWP